jgi:hypothetical protein
VRQQRTGANGQAESLNEGERVVVGWTDDAEIALADMTKEET